MYTHMVFIQTHKHIHGVYIYGRVEQNISLYDGTIFNPLRLGIYTFSKFLLF